MEEHYVGAADSLHLLLWTREIKAIEEHYVDASDSLHLLL